jgi:hypothetical protein
VVAAAPGIVTYVDLPLVLATDVSYGVQPSRPAPLRTPRRSAR